MNDGRWPATRAAWWRAARPVWACMLACSLATAANAQNVVVNPGGGSYATLKGAFDAINAGTHTGAVTVSIVASTTETAPAVLNASGTGAASYTSITVAPTGGAARSITGNIAGALVELNGADNVVIDGRNTSGNALTLSNTATGNASTVRLIGDASSNTLTNLTILGSGSVATTGTVLFATGTTTGNDGNTLSNSRIGPAGSNLPINGVYSSGSPAPADNSGNGIQNCEIFDYFNAALETNGVLIAANNGSWNIVGNRLYQTATRTYAAANTHGGIRIASGSGHAVTDNVIGFASASGTGTYQMAGSVASRYVAINLAVGTSAPTSVQGNVVTAISLATTSNAPNQNGVFSGINLTSGNAVIGTVSPNIIGALTGTAAISVASTATGALLVGINSSSTGTVTISGNLLGALASTGAAATAGGSVTGIQVSGIATSMTIANNIVGNTTADNLRGGISGLTTGSSLAIGINLPSTPAAVSITGNTIRNLAAYGTGASGSVRGISTGAATGNSTTFTIESNLISNLISDTSNSGIANGNAAAVGIQLGVGSNSTIAGNTISNVARTNTGSVGGFAAGIAHGNAANTTIARNRIFDIRNASTSTSITTPGIAAGIVLRSGVAAINVANNMIALGTGQITDTAFIGIQANHGSTPDPVDRIHYNTINISGTAAAGVQSSFGFLRGDFSAVPRTVTVDFRNNLVTNSRSGGSGAHYAIANNFGATAVSAVGWGANASDYNVLNANSATVGHWGSALTFSGWQSTAASDASSFSGITVNYINSANDLHLAMGSTPTVIESGATPIAGITTDFDGQTRPGPSGSINGGARAPDIGADEIDGVFLDATPPVIDYTPLTNTSLTTNRVLQPTLVDITGVATGSLAPRIYFRRGAGAYVSQACSLATGSATNGTWNCPIDHATIGGVTTGDVVSYFVIAQDVGGFLRSNPAGAVATSVNNVTTPPASPSSYQIAVGYSGSINVGTGQTYTSLTNAGGLFEALNAGVLVGDVNVNITSDLLAETGSNALNEWVEDGVGGYELLIRPVGAARTVSGSFAGALIRLNGADRVRIDGSTTGGTAAGIGGNAALRELTIQNTDTSTAASVIALLSGNQGAQDNTLRNLVVLGQDPATTQFGIAIGGATAGSPGADNDGNRVENCAVRRVRVGIYSGGAGDANRNTGTVVAMNDLSATGADRVRTVGIQVLADDGARITENRVGGLDSSDGSDSAAVALGVQSLSISALPAGGVVNALVSRNSVDGVSQSNTFSAIGIAVGSAVGGANVVVNNMVSRITGNTTSGDLVAGIFVTGAAGSTTRVVHNSVALTGTRPAGGTMPSYALAIGIGDPTVELRNNALSNTQTSGGNASARSYAIGLASTAANLDTDHNAYFASGPDAGVFRIGTLDSGVGTEITTLAAWRDAINDDANSLQADPLFVSNVDLHLQGASPLLRAGTPVGVTIDIDNDPRPATTPSIGADEPIADVSVTKSNGASSVTPGQTTIYTIVASNPGTTTGATLTDTFPAALTCTWTCAGSGGATCTPSGTGSINDSVNLPSGGAVTYTATCAIAAGAVGTLSNTATVTATVFDPNPGNNSATDTDPIVPAANLGITKGNGTSTVTPGSNTTYEIVASNAGPSNAGATVLDTPPSSLACVWTCSGAAGGTCPGSGTGGINAAVNLPSGASVRFVLTCAISATATGMLSNTATVSSTISDPNTGNNSATDVDTLVPNADLGITIDNAATILATGQSTVYTVIATNSGPSVATGATVSTALPAALTNPSWACIPAASTATCPVPGAGTGPLAATVSLGVGQSLRFDVMALVNGPPGAMVTSTATIAVPSGTIDSSPGNNTASDTDMIMRPDLIFLDGFEPLTPPRIE